MEAKNWYIIILVVSLLVTIFSFINFIQFLNIRNDDDPTVSENSSLALIILNGLVTFCGFIISLYCIWQLVKKDNYEPKAFQTYRNEYKRTNADVPENPLEACDEIAKLKDNPQTDEEKDDTAKFSEANRYNKLNIDMRKFAADCNEFGITPDVYQKRYGVGLGERVDTELDKQVLPRRSTTGDSKGSSVSGSGAGPTGDMSGGGSGSGGGGSGSGGDGAVPTGDTSRTVPTDSPPGATMPYKSYTEMGASVYGASPLPSDTTPSRPIIDGSAPSMMMPPVATTMRGPVMMPPVATTARPVSSTRPAGAPISAGLVPSCDKYTTASDCRANKIRCKIENKADGITFNKCEPKY